MQSRYLCLAFLFVTCSAAPVSGENTTPYLYSYFSPQTNNTVNTSNVTIPKPLMTGEQVDMAIVCNIPKAVIFMKNGVEVNRHLLASFPRGAQYFQGLFYYAHGNKVRASSPEGQIYYEWTLPKEVSALNFKQLDEATMMVGYTAPHNSSVANSVELFHLNFNSSGQPAIGFLRSIHRVSEPVSTPRSVDMKFINGAWHIVISDTVGSDFGRTIITKLDTGQLTDLFPYNSMPSYFPNDSRWLDDGRILITAEHENRIFIWNPVDNSRTMVLSAPVPPFNDITKSKADIVSAIADTSATSPSYFPVYSPPKQNVAQEYHSDISLYAPNQGGYEKDGKTLLIVDTDNGRVIRVRNGKIVTQVTGLNNPVNASVF